MRNHLDIQLGLDSGGGDKGDTTFPISISGPRRGEYREALMQLTGTALPFKLNLRLDCTWGEQ